FYGDDHEALIIKYATVEGCEFDQTIELALTYGDGVTVKNAGDYTATLVWDDCKVLNADEDEIATVGGKGGLANYKLSLDSISSRDFEIKKRSIEVKIADQTSTYGDSLPTDFGYTFESGDIDGELPYGDVLEIEYIYNCGEDKDVTPKDAKDYDVSYSSYIIYADGDASKSDIASLNYDCTITDGTLTIGKRPILVTTGSATKTYDGTPLTAEDYEKVEYAVKETIDGEEVWVASTEKVGLLEGDSLTVDEDSITSITDCGEADNTTSYTNDNYDIHYAYGKLKITRLTVSFQLSELSLEYVYGQNVALGATPNQTLPDDIYGGFIFVKDGAIAEHLNVGSYFVTFGYICVNKGTENEEVVETELELSESCDGTVNTQNYTIIFSHGTL
ncbi:MAG: hypothetical protein K2N47_02855, partial [Clostridia bacterium]|nr:hypothetical protein [Clostridia bacterium]